MGALVTAMVLFVGGHFVLSAAPLRDRLVGMLGEKGFAGAYSALMIALLVWAGFAYGDAPYVELWGTPVWTRHLAPLLVLPGVVLVALALLTPNPMAVMGEGLLQRDDPAPGVFRITRHPMMWGIALWAVAHLMANGDAASLVLFGGLLILALGGSLHIDAKRKRKAPEGFARMAATTSWLPFAAIVGGRNRMPWRDIGWAKVGVGVVVFAVVFWLHPWLFGVAPMGG